MKNRSAAAMLLVHRKGVKFNLRKKNAKRDRRAWSKERKCYAG